jgi:prefoldin subunit 5
MREQIEARIADLRRDHQLGQGQLQELTRQAATLQETLLRIAGAIQVLEELVGPGPDAASPNGRPAEPELLRAP